MTASLKGKHFMTMCIWLCAAIILVASGHANATGGTSGEITQNGSVASADGGKEAFANSVDKSATSGTANSRLGAVANYIADGVKQKMVATQ